MEQVIVSRIYSQALKGNLVFLSASFPSEQGHPDFFKSARPFDITDAVVATARAVFGATGGLVFGGHPTISPLILSVGRDFLDEFPKENRPFVHVCQSGFYEAKIPEETRKLKDEGIGEIYLVPAIDNDREKSLWEMRNRMIGTQPVAGIFIGGMEGVYQAGSDFSEFALFKKLCPGRPIYPVGSAGGASRILLNRILEHEEPLEWRYKQITPEDLRKPTPYSVLMSRVVSDIIAQL